MIVKNESKNIERCLKSVEGLVNEIVIVDTGSTDKTIEIAKSMNGNVFTETIEPFSFAKARNLALRRCIGTWILHLDADEELDPDSIEIIEKIIEADDPKGYICNLINKLPDGDLGYFKSCRLFKNNEKAYYIRDCHEEISYSLFKLGYELAESEINIIHHGYNAPDEVIKNKANRNLELLLKMYTVSPHWMTAYQIGQSYIALGIFGKAKRYLKTAIESPHIDPQFKREIVNILNQI